MKKKISLIGTGGHCRVAINLLELRGYKIDGIYDQNQKAATGEIINSYQVKGGVWDAPKANAIVLAVGDNIQRENLFGKLDQRVLEDNIIHPKAIIEKRCSMGKSNQICCGAYLNANVSIGSNNIINTGCIIEHETKIGSHNHISVGAILCGRASVGDRCFVGAGAVVIDKISICSDVIVGANSVVIEDIKEAGTYVGCPARKIK